MFPTYFFYRENKINEETSVRIKRLATKEERAELEQIKLDMIKKYQKKSFNEIYKNPKLLNEYRDKVNHFLFKSGFESYAKAFIIDRPSNLQGVVDYFAPKFNSMQVIRYLTTKRFKEIPRTLHEQLTEQLIKN